MVSKVHYKASVERDLKKLDKSAVARIIHKLERTLSADPHAGEPLRGEFRGLFKFRIGDYRVVYARTTYGVLVLRINHRREVYR